MAQIQWLAEKIGELNIGAVVILTLGFLAVKEISLVRDSPLCIVLSKYLNIPIIISIAIFVFMVASRVFNILENT